MPFKPGHINELSNSHFDAREAACKALLERFIRSKISYLRILRLKHSHEGLLLWNQAFNMEENT